MTRILTAHVPHPFWWGLIVFYTALTAPYRLQLRGVF